MVVFSIKKLENNIRNKTITSKQFIVYSALILGSTFSLFKTSKYPVNIEAYNIVYFLTFIPTLIHIIKYIYCYKIIKEKDIFLYLYAIIPISFVLSLRYALFVMLPLAIVNFNLIKYFKLDYNFWNIINLQIIEIIITILMSINFIIIIKRLYNDLDKVENIKENYIEINNEGKIILKKIQKEGIIYLGITIIAIFISIYTFGLIFSVILYIWTLWVFKVIEYFTQIRIEKKHIKTSAISLSLNVIIFLVWFYFFAFTYDKLENENIKIIFIIAEMVLGILFVINTVIGIQNLITIIRIYYKGIKERNNNK
jgi:hypothetical protein